MVERAEGRGQGAEGRGQRAESDLSKPLDLIDLSTS